MRRNTGTKRSSDAPGNTVVQWGGWKYSPAIPPQSLIPCPWDHSDKIRVWPFMYITFCISIPAFHQEGHFYLSFSLPMECNGEGSSQVWFRRQSLLCQSLSYEAKPSLWNQKFCLDMCKHFVSTFLNLGFLTSGKLILSAQQSKGPYRNEGCPNNSMGPGPSVWQGWQEEEGAALRHHYILLILGPLAPLCNLQQPEGCFDMHEGPL